MPQGIQKWTVQCRNTAAPLGEHQIEIPFPKHLNQATSPPPSERDTAESVIVCLQCEQAYLYKGKEAYPLLFQTDDESEYPYPVAVCIVLSCAVEGCK